jgi:hypothetical protein
MQFWKKYKAKKELRKKLKEARFINFYGNEIDLSLGQIIKAHCFTAITREIDLFNNECDTVECFIVLTYENFLERSFHIGTNIESIRDKYCRELNDFIKSGKFTERLNKYEELKKEHEKL